MLARWGSSSTDAREQISRAKTPRERWHALWLLARGRPAAQVAQALERDLHMIGEGLSAFAQDGPPALAFEPGDGSPPPSPQTSKPR